MNLRVLFKFNVVLSLNAAFFKNSFGLYRTKIIFQILFKRSLNP